MSQAEQLANDAIFVRQLNWDRAIRFVMQSTRMDRASAQETLRKVMLWYRQK
jgi:hypothetical protein